MAYHLKIRIIQKNSDILQKISSGHCYFLYGSFICTKIGFDNGQNCGNLIVGAF